ncbi:hypothetical protein [Conexibacter woesei]|uniref:Uncharacterized protein n=1 Tax=Conexibacter woesei (strain DSM 14684 / CCUG 47730 / CIP 108061 / JCM 11494 / NBRC 100937 / ID131577) TaxID=469383 RepID=D3F3Y1_CONWI|nr:hypothetical protein [Conexibacter woesei]ADB48464.1 hypothetical protein Cwoe_0028 [Conexibacter woesei DSM 14684]
MPDRVPQQDAELAALLARLALDDLPEPLVRAVVESLEWAVRLDREAASRVERGPTRPR